MNSNSQNSGKIEVSVIVPLYNEEESVVLLYESINSVMDKTKKNYDN